MIHYLLLSIAIVFEVVATFLLRASDGLSNWRFTLGSLICYLVAGVILSFVLEHIAVGIAYAIWAGSGIALICIASVAFFGQKFDAPAVVGIVLIVAGVGLITLRSSVAL